MVIAHLIDIVNDGRFEDSRKEVETALLGALQFLGKDDVMVEVSLVSDEQMAQINKESRGQEGSTIVLSFEEPKCIPQPEGEPVQLGEIYLAPDTIKRGGYKISRLAVHALLHLLGYTHKRRSDTIKMEELENEIWQTLLQD